YERVLSIDSAHEVASRELEQLYTAREDWAQLAQLQLDRASRTGDIEPLIEVAHLYEVKPADPHAPFLVMVTAMRREPERPHLVEQLDRVGAAAGLDAELIGETRALAEEIEAAHPGPAAALW